MKLPVIVGLLVLLSFSAAAQSNPPKLAGQARFDLFAGTSVGAITNGQALTDNGSFARMNWIAAVDQPRSYTVQFSVSHFAWSEFVFRFTPANNGAVELRLMGPWEESSPGGPIFRQEVFWDSLSATNTSLPNGSFESLNGSLPAGWNRPYGDAAVASNTVPPAAGLRYARTWHDGPLTASLPVTGGVPVTLRFFARAVAPTNFTDMARITDTNSPAHQAARRLMRGVNLGNYLEAPPGQNWGASYSTNDFRWIREEGFDHVRLPIAWHHHTGPAPNYTLSNLIFAQADFLVTNALNQGLGVLVNIHHFDDFTSNPSAWTNKFYSIWRQLAAHYSNSPSRLALELLNEPKDAATTVVLNPIYAEAIRQIRLIDPQRTIFVGPGSFNSIGQLGNLRLPDGDANLIVTVHSYDPFLFTHQGASWTLPDTATTGFIFPGPPVQPLAPAPGVASWVTNWIHDYNSLPEALNPSSPAAFRGRLAFAKQWSDYYGRPVHVGEFGSYDTYTDGASRVRFYEAMRGRMDELGLGWAMWDWKAGFHYWQQTGNTGAPDPPGMREAMFPKALLRTSARGQLDFDAAVGKTFRIHRTAALDGVSPWSAISTQTLLQPMLWYNDPAAVTNDASFYRVEWVKQP